MKYKVDLDPQAYAWGTPNPHIWIASVECDEPSPCVLLRNRSGNLEQCLRAIGDAMTKHSLNPWHIPETRP